MKITLLINGRQKSFSEEELIAKLEKLEKLEYTAVTPVEGTWFEVDVTSINKRLFEEEMKDLNQESTRQLILKAFEETEKNPYMHSTRFQTLIPKKEWQSKTVEELYRIAHKYSGIVADWVYQALEWAQRIQNGETWESLCNSPDHAEWYRLISWDGVGKLIGGSIRSTKIYPATTISHTSYDSAKQVSSRCVPLIVRYEHHHFPI